MKSVFWFCGAVAMSALAIFIMTLTWVTAQVPAKLDGVRGDVNTQIEFARLEVAHQVEAARKDLLTRSDAQLTALRVDTFERVDTAIKSANQRVGDSLARVDVALDTVQGIRADLHPILDQAVLIEQHTDKTIIDLHPQLLGLVAASKVTAGQTAETMRDIQRATPGFIATWQQIGNHVNLMSDAGAKSFIATQHTMENFAAASKPLPTWARIALGVGPPVAQAGAAAVGAGAILGWIK